MKRAGSRIAIRALLGALAGIAAGSAAEAAPCDSWAGEPVPLPTVADRDVLMSEWATLRTQELAARAASIEASDPMQARQLWRHVLCLDPSNDAALAGMVRTPPVALHRPVLRDVGDGAQTAGDPWQGLAAPVGVKPDRRAARRAAAQVRQLVDLRDAVSETEEQVRNAQFERAVRRATQLRVQLAEAPRGRTRTDLTARLEVLAGTSQLALGREADARTSFARALVADPALTLDPATNSPKVLRALDAVRSESPR